MKEKSSGMKSRWQAEKDQIQKLRSLKERVDELRTEAERATRTADLQRAAEIQYGEIPRTEQDIGQAEARLGVCAAGNSDRYL